MRPTFDFVTPSPATFPLRSLFMVVKINRSDPQAKLDLVRQLVALRRLRELPTVAARRRAYRRIPKLFARAVCREMAAMTDDLRRRAS